VNAKAEDLAPETVEPGELLTIDQGLGVSDDQNSLKAHVRGPTLEVAGLDTI
jgi:catalase